ncbi:MAG: 2-oxo acid dehydrogenase subunit E2, partial [Alphaproteobacteria bacterium]|nr:2-oxo acid dehydrogenase subunit E2 [Alphaproteobacteria bacterium]
PATKHPAPAPASESAKSGAARAADTPKSGAARAADTPKSGAARAADTPKSGAARAAPAVRALAEELKVDLDRIEGTGPHGAILRADVQAAASGRTRPKPLGPEWQSLRGVRKAMARSMTAALSIPRATVTEEADVGHWPDDVPVTLVLVQAMVRALDREPALNAAYDGEREARRLNPDAAIGIAVDTADGLIVPVLRTADFPDPHDLRGELRRLVEGAQRRSLSPADLRGATITLSNFGAIGGLFAELVIVPPQVAILGAGRLRDGRLPLSLTFDHRAVNGGEAARFLSAIKTHLEQTD